MTWPWCGRNGIYKVGGWEGGEGFHNVYGYVCEGGWTMEMCAGAADACKIRAVFSLSIIESFQVNYWVSQLNG